MPKRGKGHQKHGGPSREGQERKRDERARKSALKKERGIKEYLENDENFVSFSNQLQAIGYKIKDIKGDGNCLFRALSDQLEGDDLGHLRHRRIVTQYISDHRDEFEPFIEDNMTFDKHVKELSKPGTHGGNDSIVAFSRKHAVNIIIHQLNEPCWVIQGTQYMKTTGSPRELHISYHNGDHYSSVRRIGDPDNGPAWEYNNKNVKINEKTTNDVKPGSKPRRKESPKGAESSADDTSELTIIKAATGCEDTKLIEQTLVDSNYDIDATISYILQVQCTVNGTTDCESNNSNCEIDEPTADYTQHVDQHFTKKSTTKTEGKHDGGARPKQLSNKKRKEAAKQEKKARRMEERREEIKRGNEMLNQNVEQVSQLPNNIEALTI